MLKVAKAANGTWPGIVGSNPTAQIPGRTKGTPDEKTTRLPLSGDRRFAVEWGMEPRVYILKRKDAHMGMLVLSRKADEGITITVPPSAVEQQIRVKLIEIRGDKSRIGLAASPEVVIHRDEIQRAIEQKALPLLRIGDALPGVQS